MGGSGREGGRDCESRLCGGRGHLRIRPADTVAFYLPHILALVSARAEFCAHRRMVIILAGACRIALQLLQAEDVGCMLLNLTMDERLSMLPVQHLDIAPRELFHRAQVVGEHIVRHQREIGLRRAYFSCRP